MAAIEARAVGDLEWDNVNFAGVVTKGRHFAPAGVHMAARFRRGLGV